jgi:hypothetical protein
VAAAGRTDAVALAAITAAVGDMVTTVAVTAAIMSMVVDIVAIMVVMAAITAGMVANKKTHWGGESCPISYSSSTANWHLQPGKAVE